MLSKVFQDKENEEEILDGRLMVGTAGVTQELQHLDSLTMFVGFSNQVELLLGFLSNPGEVSMLGSASLSPTDAHVSGRSIAINISWQGSQSLQWPLAPMEHGSHQIFALPPRSEDHPAHMQGDQHHQGIGQPLMDILDPPDTPVSVGGEEPAAQAHQQHIEQQQDDHPAAQRIVAQMALFIARDDTPCV